MSTYLAQVNFNTLRGVFPAGTLPNNPSLTIGEIVSRFLPYLFAIGGLILLFFLVMGGVGLMTSSGDPKAVDAAKGRITNALIGFLLLFTAYWIAKILQTVLGLPAIF